MKVKFKSKSGREHRIGVNGRVVEINPDTWTTVDVGAADLIALVPYCAPPCALGGVLDCLPADGVFGETPDLFTAARDAFERAREAEEVPSRAMAFARDAFKSTLAAMPASN